MQHANDDMDSLMRKAGVDYPLFTGSADWSKLAAAMEAGEGKPLPKRNYGKYLGLILVFLLPWFLTQFDPQKLNGSGTGTKETTTNEKIITGQTGKENETVNVFNPAETNEPHGGIVINTPENRGSSISLVNSKPSQKQDRRRKQSTVPVERPGKPSTITATQTETNQAALQESKNKSQTNTAIGGSIAGKNAIENDNTPVATPADKVENKQETTTTTAAVPSTVSTQPRKKFYLGLVGGMNFTTIKMQEVSEIGSDFGLIAGYKFSKGWSIEAGVLSSKKYYYSDGEYLNNPKIYLPPNTKITAVQGDCRMIEIPLVLKYDFGFKKSHNWFASAGISSFLMKQEDYAYDYYYTTTGTTQTYSKTYENESKDWAAVMQISAGYMRSIPLGMNLRLEPFIQIPLKGAGYGNLPLTSAGLRLGITKTLF